MAEKGVPAAGLIGYTLGYYLVELARNNEFVRRGFEEGRRRDFSEDKERSLLKRIYDYPLEHPGIAAAIAGAMPSAYVAGMALANEVNPFTALSSPLEAGLVFYSGLFAAAAYLGMSALSWVLHSDSLRLMGNSAMARIDSLTGRLDSAIEHQLKVMEIPTNPANERKNRFRLGDLYLRNGSIEDALNEYYKAVQLVGKKGQAYTNPIDAISGVMSSINPLMALKGGWRSRDEMATNTDEINENSESLGIPADEYRKRFCKGIHWWEYMSEYETLDTSAQSRLERFARQVRARDFNDADRTMRLVVRSEPKNPEYHLLYAKFLDVVGDNELAGEEYLAAIRLLVGNPGIAGNFERIGVSRNEVLTYSADRFLKKTLIFKRSEKRDEITQEYENLRYFHERLGDRIAKPLAMLDSGRWTYLIMEHAGEKTLANLAEEGKLTYSCIADTINLLSKIHSIGEEYGR